MSRNRRTQSANVRLAPLLKALLLCLFIGGAGVGYVWQKDQVRRLGLQIKEREIHLKQLVDENEKRRKQLATLQSPPFLEQRIRELNLGLVAPQQVQIWRLNEPMGDGQSRLTEPQRPFAARDAHMALIQ